MTKDEARKHGVGKTWASHILTSLVVLGGIFAAYVDAKGDIRSNTEAIAALEKTLTDPAIGVQVKLSRVERIVVRLADRAGIDSD